MIKVTEQSLENFKLNVIRDIQNKKNVDIQSRLEEIIIENPFLFATADNVAFAIMQTLGIPQEGIGEVYPIIMSLFITTYSLMNIQHDLELIRNEC